MDEQNSIHLQLGVSVFFGELVPLWAFAEANGVDTSRVVGAIMEDYERAALQEIQGFCAREWPTDYTMQNHCFEKSVEARRKAQELDLMKSLENMIIWSNCAEEWTDNQDRLDWVMMDHCIKEQLEALKNIQDRRLQ